MTHSAASSSRIDAIQSLRAVAAVLVLLVHSADSIREGHAPVAGGFAPALPNLAAFGASGVDLFFVISGFVMAQAIAADRGGAAAFLASRWRRIVPLFVLVGIVFALLRPGDIAPRSYLYLVTILPILDTTGYHAPALFVGWTLGFEAVFYLLAALALRASAGRRAPVLFTVTLAVAIAGMVVHPGWAPARLLVNPLMAEFALGVGAWLAWRAGWTRRWGGVERIAGIALLVWGLLFGLGLPVVAHYADAVAGTSGAARAWTWGLPWALVLAGSLRTGGTGWASAIGRRLGDASYSIYLVHPCVLLLAERWLTVPMGAGAWTLTIVAASCLTGLALHDTVEAPLLAWSRRRRAGSARVFGEDSQAARIDLGEAALDRDRLGLRTVRLVDR